MDLKWNTFAKIMYATWVVHMITGLLAKAIWTVKQHLTDYVDVCLYVSIYADCHVAVLPHLSILAIAAAYVDARVPANHDVTDVVRIPRQMKRLGRVLFVTEIMVILKLLIG